MSKTKYPANMALLTASEHFLLNFAYISAPLNRTCEITTSYPGFYLHSRCLVELFMIISCWKIIAFQPIAKFMKMNILFRLKKLSFL